VFAITLSSMKNDISNIPLVVFVGPSGVGKKMDRRWVEHQ